MPPLHSMRGLEREGEYDNTQYVLYGTQQNVEHIPVHDEMWTFMPCFWLKKGQKVICNCCLSLINHTYWVYRKFRATGCRMSEMLMSVRINDFGLVLMSRRKEEEGNRGEDSTRRHMAEFAGHTRSERRIHDLFHAQHIFRFQA